MENIIPFKIMREAIEKSCDENLDAYDAVVEEGFREYCDFKNGVVKGEAVRLDGEHGEYWCSIDGFHRLSEDQYLTPSLGGNIASVFTSIFKRLSPHHVEQKVKDIDEEWISLTAMLSAWGVCRKKKVK